ncbi:Alpha/Beta hydrolase protein [Syncephalastrum racemosum]|uniref:Alpha/Beta hydrolase protein n=1 Tax=Syncephalastrum racemosum TaxID=13706 RepID=A0A1X2HCK3_SYNRA|nr:Alpha/Beta hydrolase protein [Syncephalastrum racemosum]
MAEPFEIPSISAEERQRLVSQLQDVSWPDQLEDVKDWSYGAPRWAVEPMAKAWVEFDWEKTRAELNKWHHYHVNVDGLRLHCIHETSKDQDAIPIMLLHGWPSSFYEFHKVIDALRDGRDAKQAFHVVVPSLPGYGFSEAPKTSGFGIMRMGDILDKLMKALGYSSYVAQGTDWGSAITHWLAVNRPASCRAAHTNMPMALPPIPTPGNLISQPWRTFKFCAALALGLKAVYGDQVKIFDSFANAEKDRESGYRAIQGTRPYTLAYGLNNNALGLMAWILEKFHNWTDHGASDKDTSVLPPSISQEEFLSQITIYWITKSVGSSIRLYYEALHLSDMKDIVTAKTTIPMGASIFPCELGKPPLEWIESSHPHLVQYKEHEAGGHFAALEVPDLWLSDVQRFGATVKKNVVS